MLTISAESSFFFNDDGSSAASNLCLAVLVKDWTSVSLLRKEIENLTKAFSAEASRYMCTCQPNPTRLSTNPSTPNRDAKLNPARDDLISCFIVFWRCVTVPRLPECRQEKRGEAPHAYDCRLGQQYVGTLQTSPLPLGYRALRNIKVAPCAENVQSPGWDRLWEPKTSRLQTTGRNKNMERETGFEPATSTLARSHSTTELLPLSVQIIN